MVPTKCVALDGSVVIVTPLVESRSNSWGLLEVMGAVD
jgi:hypothetical protein